MTLGDAADGGHDLARCAETALHSVMVDEGLLDRVEFVAVRQSFNRGDFGAVMHRRQCQARDDSLAVEKNRARTARALIAALLGAGEIEMIAQRVEQSRPRRDGKLCRFAVDRQRNRHFNRRRDAVFHRLRHAKLSAGILAWKICKENLATSFHGSHAKYAHGCYAATAAARDDGLRKTSSLCPRDRGGASRSRS